MAHTHTVMSPSLSLKIYISIYFYCFSFGFSAQISIPLHENVLQTILRLLFVVYIRNRWQYLLYDQFVVSFDSSSSSSNNNKNIKQDNFVVACFKSSVSLFDVQRVFDNIISNWVCDRMWFSVMTSIFSLEFLLHQLRWYFTRWHDICVSTNSFRKIKWLIEINIWQVRTIDFPFPFFFFFFFHQLNYHLSIPFLLNVDLSS